MLKNAFVNETEFNIYLAEQKIRMEKGYLTVSERKTLKGMLEKNYKPNIMQEAAKKIEIVYNRKLLSTPCDTIQKDEDISNVIRDLKTAMTDYPYAVGFTANQLGYNKRISFVKMIIRDQKTQQFKVRELILINAKITEKTSPYKFTEACMSFPKIVLQTKRYRVVTVSFENEKREQVTETFYDYNAVIVQHEIGHQQGKTIFDAKWRCK